jgi:hypothetical protein
MLILNKNKFFITCFEIIRLNNPYQLISGKIGDYADSDINQINNHLIPTSLHERKQPSHHRKQERNIYYCELREHSTIER